MTSAEHLSGGRVLFERPSAPFSGGLSPFLIRKVEAFVDGHLHTRICLNDLARLTDLSAAYFCRSFHRSTGMTPMVFVRRRRVALARRLLETTELSLTDVALSCGFDRRSAMAKAFRLVGEVRPHQYRVSR